MEADNQLQQARTEYEDYLQEEQNRKRQEPKPAKVKEEEATPDTKLRDLIPETDYQYKQIPEDMTVQELRDRMQAGEEYYDICDHVDTVIREKHFGAISTAYNIDYEEVYQTRLHR